MSKLSDLRQQCKDNNVVFDNTHTAKQLELKLIKKVMADTTKKGVITKEQIAEWKKQHNKVHKLSVIVKKDADGNIKDEAVGYLKNPSRNHKATAMSMYAQNKILECGEFLRNNCWLGGDERLKDKGEIADTAAIQANGIIEFLEGELGEA